LLINLKTLIYQFREKRGLYRCNVPLCLAEYARAMAAGIDAFYSKPFEPNVLVQYFKARGVIR
jgi:hypothetical protein